jgi:hypothetical protein
MVSNISLHDDKRDYQKGIIIFEKHKANFHPKIV